MRTPLSLWLLFTGWGQNGRWIHYSFLFLSLGTYFCMSNPDMAGTNPLIFLHLVLFLLKLASGLNFSDEQNESQAFRLMKFTLFTNGIALNWKKFREITSSYRPLGEVLYPFGYRDRH